MEKISQDLFLNFRYLGNLKASPDETKAAFIVSHAHHEKNEYHHTLYLKDHEGVKKLKKLGKNNAFIFENNDTLLINYQKNKAEEKAVKDKSTHSFYRYHLTAKSLEKAFDLDFSASMEKMIDEDHILLSASLTPKDHTLYEANDEEKKEYLKTKKRDASYEDIDELPYYFNGIDFKTDKHKQLFIYKISDASLSPVVSKTFDIKTFTLSHDHSTIYYTGDKDQNVMQFTSKIYAYDIASSTHKIVYDKTDYNIEKIIDLSGNIVLAAKTMDRFGMNENPDFYVLKDNQLNHLATHSESLGNRVGSDAKLLASALDFIKDDTYYFTTTIDDHSELRRLSLDGTLKTVFTMEGSMDGLCLHNDKALLIGMKNQRLQELYDFDYTQNELTMLTRLNSSVLAKKYVAKPKEIVVKKATHEVKGYALLPKDYDKSKPYPLILDIHGGPKTVYGKVYYHEMQHWASEGYIVIFANPRGSDGKGNDFADIRGKYGTIDYEDLMDFTDQALKEIPNVDQDNMFVTGGSYGGFMTNWIVGHTDRFKAAVTQRSISNWFSFYGTSDIGYFFAKDQTDGHPIKDMEKLYDQSPIKYAMNMKTPLLFIHSDKDHRCPMEQAQQLYAILKVNGLDTKLVWIKGENHELSRSGKPQARMKRLSEMTNWFHKYKG